jgi:hypothetical protein
MKIEKIYYIIMKEGHIEIPGNETVYISHSEDSGFTNDILEADRFADRKGALMAMHDYEMKHNYISEPPVKLVSMKVTYEW